MYEDNIAMVLPGHLLEGAMTTVRSYKFRKIASVLLVLVTSLGFVVCLSSAAPLDHLNVSSTGQDSDASTHSRLELHCLIMVLPSALVLVFLRATIFYATPVAAVRLLPASPPFRPPESVYAR